MKLRYVMYGLITSPSTPSRPNIPIILAHNHVLYKQNNSKYGTYIAVYPETYKAIKNSGSTPFIDFKQMKL